MNISKKILRAINEGVYNALSFDDDLPDVGEVSMHKISNQLVNDALDKEQTERHILALCKDPSSITQEEFYNLYNECKRLEIKYNPHLDGRDFRDFVKSCIQYTNNNINLNWIDTSDVTDMSNLFTMLDFNGNISEWDVSNVTNMHSIFFSSHFNRNITKWDTSKVDNLTSAFYYSLIDLKNLPYNLKIKMVLQVWDAFMNYYNMLNDYPKVNIDDKIYDKIYRDKNEFTDEDLELFEEILKDERPYVLRHNGFSEKQIDDCIEYLRNNVVTL